MGPSKKLEFEDWGEADEKLVVDTVLSLADSLEQTTLQDTDEKQYDLIDTRSKMEGFLNKCSGLSSSPPSLFLDIEGVNLGRHGSISIVQVFVRPYNRTFLVDVFQLGPDAFDCMGRTGRSFRDILEDLQIPKVFFDVRHDSDALYHLYNVKLAGVHDIQLMELATRTGQKGFVSGLKRCVQSDVAMSATERLAWNRCKENGRKLFAPEHGGSYEVFNFRPLVEDILQYCVQDVQYLPELWNTYNGKLTKKWRQKVRSEVKSRIQLSQLPSFPSSRRQMIRGPPGW